MHHEAVEAMGAAATAVFTFALFLSTLGLWLATQETVRIAERSLTELEAPVIDIEFEDPGIKIYYLTNTPTRHRGRLSYRFKNFGRSPARIIGYTQKFVEVPFGSGPPLPIRVPQDLDMIPHMGFLVPPNVGGSDPIPLYLSNVPQEPTIEEFATIGIPSNQEPIPSIRSYLLIAARYRDVFQACFDVGFAYIFDYSRNVWVQTADGEDYNFYKRSQEVRRS